MRIRLLCTEKDHTLVFNTVTVIPEALPRRFVSLKPIVTAKHNSIKVQFISGI
jgi:hypothetical protein